MKHCSEEELIEYYYGEGGRACGLHLATCAECAGNYAELQGTLGAIRPIAPPAPGAEFGKQVWESLAQRLPPAPSRKAAWMGMKLWRGMAFAGAGALIVAGAFYAGRLWEHHKPPVTAAHTPVPVEPRLVVVVLGDHLDRTERLLVALKHADASSAEMVSPLRDEARSLLAANRVCLENTDQEDDPALAQTLDRIENLLNEIVNQPGGLNPKTVVRLQNEMSMEGLLFEVRVLRSRIADQETDKQARVQGGTT